MDIKPFATSLWGDEKTLKTTMALTWPRPLVHLEVDIGGFERAAWRMPDLDGIESFSFPIPLAINKLMGAEVSVSSVDELTINLVKRMTGMRETWQKLMIKFIEAVQKEDVKTIVFDSWTRTWTICHSALLQEMQEKLIAGGVKEESKDFRQRLLTKEYGPANDKMDRIIDACKSYNKNLVLIQYPTDIYGTRMGNQGMEEYKTGEVKPDGYKHTAKKVELVIKINKKEVEVDKVKQKIGEALITTCGLGGLGINAEGLYLPEASYQGIVTLRNMMMGV